MTSQAAAEQYIEQHDWSAKLPAVAAHLQRAGGVSADLQAAHQSYSRARSDGTWVRKFSGREIFRDARGFIVNKRYASREEMDVDLMRSVAQWQVENNAVPPDMEALRDALPQRVAV